jgi:hypothetical protein
VRAAGHETCPTHVRSRQRLPSLALRYSRQVRHSQRDQAIDGLSAAHWHLRACICARTQIVRACRHITHASFLPYSSQSRGSSVADVPCRAKQGKSFKISLHMDLGRPCCCISPQSSSITCRQSPTGCAPHPHLAAARILDLAPPCR